MTNTGKQYEKLAQMVFSHINNLNRDGVETIKVQHNVKLQGKTTKHQIDVYWEFRVGIVTHKVIVQAKDLTSKVSQGDMLLFKAVIDDNPGTTGIFVTTKGYQKGALEVAQAHGIYVYELREPEDDDWDGLIKTVAIKMHLVAPYCDNFGVVVDKEWLSTNNISEEQATRGRYVSTNDAVIILNSGGKRTMLSIITEICDEIGIGEQKRAVEFPDGAYIMLPNEAKLKIMGFQGIFGCREFVYEIKIDGDNIIDLILKDVVSGESQMLSTLKMRAVSEQECDIYR